MFKAFAFAVAVMATTLPAFAQSASSSSASQSAAAEPVAVTLSPQDLQMLREFVGKSGLHVSQADGSTHPYVDGMQILSFINERVALAQKDEAAEKARKEAEARKDVDAHKAIIDRTHPTSPVAPNP